MTSARDNLDDMKGRHVEDGYHVRPEICERCGEAWPCDAARLIAFTEAILDYADLWGNGVPGYVLTALAEQHLGGGK
jgi:hypothetical protein